MESAGRQDSDWNAILRVVECRAPPCDARAARKKRLETPAATVSVEKSRPCRRSHGVELGNSGEFTLHRARRMGRRGEREGTRSARLAVLAEFKGHLFCMDFKLF